MTDPPFRFNLWHEPWIRAGFLDGASAELGIGPLLATAHTVATLADPSPLVVASTHRVLVAVLQSIYNPQSLDDIEGLLKTGRFDAERLDAFADAHAERFDLFHPIAPFLQTGDVPLDAWRQPKKEQKGGWGKPKPVAVLFPELPAETNRTLYQHVTDESHRLCPACCARGLVTVPAFASSGGAGIRPSINGVPPIYVLPGGATLHQSLVLSLTTQGYQPASANWQRIHASAWCNDATVRKNQPVSAVGYLESLVFPARRMRLYPQPVTGACTSCGRLTSTAVGTMLFEMGHWLSEGSGIWDDPFVAFRRPRGGSKTAETGPRPVRPEEGKALWREYTGLLLAEREDHLRPKIVRQIAALVDRSLLSTEHNVRVRCIALRTDGKAKVFEWLDEALEVPPALLTHSDGAYLIEQVLQLANECGYIVGLTFDRHFRPQRVRGERIDQRVVRFKTLRARMLATYWERLAPEFRALVLVLAAPEQRDEALRGWAGTVARTGRRVFDDTAEQIGSRADALRARVEARANCGARLAMQRTKWLEEQGVTE